MTDQERTIGRLEAHVEQLRSQVAKQDEKLDAILALVEQGRGAKWAVGAMSAAFGGVGGLLVAWFNGMAGRG
jgi:hypothetical protein